MTTPKTRSRTSSDMQSIMSVDTIQLDYLQALNSAVERYVEEIVFIEKLGVNLFEIECIANLLKIFGQLQNFKEKISSPKEWSSLKASYELVLLALEHLQRKEKTPTLNKDRIDEFLEKVLFDLCMMSIPLSSDQLKYREKYLNLQYEKKSDRLIAISNLPDKTIIKVKPLRKPEIGKVRFFSEPPVGDKGKENTFKYQEEPSELEVQDVFSRLSSPPPPGEYNGFSLGGPVPSTSKKQKQEIHDAIPSELLNDSAKEKPLPKAKQNTHQMHRGSKVHPEFEEDSGNGCCPVC